MPKFLPAIAFGAAWTFAAACAPPAAQAPAAPTTIAVISDLNSGYGSTSYDAEVSSAVAHIVKWQPDLVLIAGDMIAGQRPSLTDENVRAMWQAFDSVVAAPLRAARIPLAFTLGNHDGSGYPNHTRDRRLATEYWRNTLHTPRVRFEDRTMYPLYYAFTAGDVFIAAMDASTGEMHRDSAQLAWLRNVFASFAARAAKQRIVLGHVPLYAVAEGRNLRGEIQGEPEVLRALLENAGVNMYVSGHHHAYYPGRRGALSLLHAGAAGSGPRVLIGTSGPAYKTITLLRVFGDSIEDTTWRIAGDSLSPVFVSDLPSRIDGINGHVIRAR